MSTKLSPAERTLLISAATQHRGTIVLPETTKPVTASRMIGKLVKNALVAEQMKDGIARHALTVAGFEAVGIAPQQPEAAGTKQDLVKSMLARSEGATLAEMMTSTGWLPHTTRAALSRLRSAGETLEKRAREDGTTAYHRPAVEPKIKLSVRKASSANSANAEA